MASQSHDCNSGENIAMKTSDPSSSLEIICKNVHEEVLAAIRDRIVNHKLSSPIDCKDYASARVSYLSRMHEYMRESHRPRILLAKCWFLFVVFAGGVLCEAFKEEPRCLRPFLNLMIATVLSLAYWRVFTAMPLESIGVTYLLNSSESRQVILEQKYNKTLRQTELAGPMGGLSFINYDLIPAFSDNNIAFFEKDSIMRAFFGLKNGVFDCISIAGLVMLLLLKKKISVRIEKVRNKSLNTVFAHCFIIVNRTQGKITDMESWNDDCMIVDPWYGLCLFIHEIRKDPGIFTKYPLLDMNEKTVIAEIKSGDKPPEGYYPFLKKLSALLHPKRKSCSRDPLDILWPSLH